jgi:curved DNA-binding protein CbpA
MAKDKAQNYYEILGVDNSATPEEIKKAYRKKSLEVHPDKLLGQTIRGDRFKLVNEAYEVLSDEEKRQKYDKLLKQQQSKDNNKKEQKEFFPTKYNIKPQNIIAENWDKARAQTPDGRTLTVVRYPTKNLTPDSVKNLREFLGKNGVPDSAIYVRFSNSLNSEIIEIAGDENIKKFETIKQNLMQKDKTSFMQKEEEKADVKKDTPRQPSPSEQKKSVRDVQWFEDMLVKEQEINKAIEKGWAVRVQDMNELKILNEIRDRTLEKLKHNHAMNSEELSCMQAIVKAGLEANKAKSQSAKPDVRSYPKRDTGHSR